MSLIQSTVILVATLLPTQGQPSAQPSSQPSAINGSITDLYAEMTVIYELSENVLRTKESWRFRNDGRARIAAEQFSLALPEGALRIVLDEDSKPFKVDAQNIHYGGPLPLGEFNLGIAYDLPLKSGDILIRRSFPFRFSGARIITEDLPGLGFSSSLKAKKRTRDLNGIVFAIWDVGGVEPGQGIELTLSGLPTRGTMLRDLTFLASALVLLWMIWALRRASKTKTEFPSPIAAEGIMSGDSRKTRLLQALEVLDEDHKTSKIDEQQYARRQKALLKSLAHALRDRELEEGPAT
jgi:hypothetical protein